MIIALALLFSGFIFLWIFNKFSRPRNYPPGPFLFPVIGVLPQFAIGGFLNSLQKWMKKFGNIFSFNLGPMRVVVLNDYDVIKNAYMMEEFSGRFFSPQTREVAGEGRRGIIAAEGASWEAQRRFALRHLRDFGFGKKSMEAATHEDIVDLIAKFRQVTGQPISTVSRFNMSVVSALWRIITGQRYDLDDPEFGLVMKTLNAAISTNAGITPVLFSMEWLIKLVPNLIGWTKFKSDVAATKGFIMDQVQGHKETYQEGNFRDFMDVYINEMNQTKDPLSSFYKTTGDENLQLVTLNLIAAGNDTTSSTLSWALYFLTRNPEIQKKFQEEIDTVIGRSRLPSLNDQKAMPFVCATIMEVFRKSSFTPVSVPHRTITDVNFYGFTIPKNTMILANLYELHHNKDIWGDPEKFRPLRFLTPDGKSIAKGHPPIAPFGIGKRQCLGEHLARNNVFLFLVSLFQVFDVKLPLTAPQEVKPAGGIFRFAPEFKVIFEER